MKIYNQIAPLIQLNLNDNLIFWCIQDAAIQGNIIQMNSKIAEHIGLEIKDKVIYVNNKDYFIYDFLV